MTGALSLAWAPLFPWPVVGLLATATLMVVVFALWRRARGTWWRALALGTLVLALANPSLVREERELRDDVALVVVAESPSPALVDPPTSSSRPLEIETCRDRTSWWRAIK